MIKAMLRYEIPVDDKSHEFSLWSAPVRVETSSDPSVVEFWAEGYPESSFPSTNVYRLQVFGTGHPLPTNARWVGTTSRWVGLVWHLYELTS